MVASLYMLAFGNIGLSLYCFFQVHCLAVSPNSKWVASASRNSVLKLWDTATGVEQFSVRLDAEVQSMTFTSNSEKLVLFTGMSTTRVLMFYISVCKKKETS